MFWQYLKTKLKPNQFTINIKMQDYIFIRKDSSKNSGGSRFLHQGKSTLQNFNKY